MDASSNQAYAACIKEALGLMEVWVPRWLGNLRATLKQRETDARHLYEKQALMEARTQLDSHRELIANRFLESFAATVEGARTTPGATARSLQTLSFDELELMGDEQVQESVESARLQQMIKLAAEDELVHLNARMSRARGLELVRAESNPLRTEMVVGALMRTLNGLHVDAAVRSRWLQTGALMLGEELQKMYAHLSTLLDSWGVAPASYHVVQVAAARPATGSPRADGGLADTVGGGDALLTLDHLHQLLVGNLDQGLSDDPVHAQGNAMVRTLAAEVVTQMLRRIAEDNRLLKPLRDLLLELKPALLQLARNEPRFFADRQNPARRLLDGITERSLAFRSEQDSGYEPFAARVRDTVRALQQPGPDVADRFAALLVDMVRSQAAALGPGPVQARGLAVQTLVRVEQRNLLAERVAAEFSSRNDFERSPGVVRRFLTGPWAQVVAQARLEAAARPSAELSPADAPALRYTDILPDLLWSSQLMLASRNRPRLVKVIPGVLRTLREGLDSIDYPREQSESFFQALMGLHEAAYKTQRNEPPPESPPSREMPLEPEPWMQPAEARDTGFMDDALMDTQPAFVETQPMQRDWADLKAEASRQQGEALPVGTWVDVAQDGEAMRCQITWASPHGTMFLLTGADGRSMSMTRRGLDRLLSQDRLRVIADHGVVDEALDAVARQAWINSGKQ
ncbi:MAG: DUF1631 family protein [Hydrogenophaga sp.]|nr:DUF1631 family protein [Hydrogenophaga sp.]